MHYTSIENIHKAIDPLFLDGLRAELEEIKEIAVDVQGHMNYVLSLLHPLALCDPQRSLSYRYGEVIVRAELEEIKEIAVDKTRKARLSAFQSKLAGLTFTMLSQSSRKALPSVMLA